MSATESRVGSRSQGAAFPDWAAGLWLPTLVAAVLVAVALAAIVAGSRSAWLLLGAGHGLVPEAYYPLSAFVLILATTLGQTVGWAAASGLAHYALTLLGLPATWATARLAMSVVYLGLVGLPLLVYHALFGAPLLGLPRTGVEEWLAASHADAYWLLVTAHPLVDLALLPLAVLFLGLLWGSGEAPTRSRILQAALALALLGTSLATAVSLAIHSTLVHIRL